jgi:hypothetical protein
VKAWWSNIVTPKLQRNEKSMDVLKLNDHENRDKMSVNTKLGDVNASTADGLFSFYNLNSTSNGNVFNAEKKPNFLARFMTPTSVTLPSDGPTKSSSKYLGKKQKSLNISQTSSLESRSIVEPPVIRKEGHLFHELVPLTCDREVDIEGDDEEKHYVDRFATESDSEDDVSRSEMSAIQELGTYISPRHPNSSIRRTTARQSRTNDFTARKRGTKLSPTSIRVEDPCIEICNICRDPLQNEKILMCERILSLTKTAMFKFMPRA